MNAPIPRFSIGRNDPVAVQDKLNRLVDAVNTLLSMRGDGRFIGVNRAAGGGMTVSLLIDAILPYIPRLATVAGAIPVMLTQTGGSDGDGTTACSWTYTVTHAISGTVLGTNVAPSHNRNKVKTTKATTGWAYYDSDGNLKVNVTDELPNFSGC